MRQEKRKEKEEKKRRREEKEEEKEKLGSIYSLLPFCCCTIIPDPTSTPAYPYLMDDQLIVGSGSDDGSVGLDLWHEEYITWRQRITRA